MQCPQCQHENPAGVKFCGECGARLEPLCPACRASNPPTNKFCQECGEPLTGAPPAAKFASPQAYTPKHLAEKILTSKSALEGERKQVTVLFADVVGFTAMSERLDPEEVHAIMDRAFDAILGAVHRYEGTINQFLGDGAMALFGAPIAHEDHAHRTLSAALAIQTELKPLADEVRRMHGIEFRMRMGVNTGLVVVGAIGKDLRMDYTAVGDTTNLAARLLSLAKPGQIVVSRRTQHLREGFFVFEDLGEFQVKGKAEPVRAYALSSEIRGRTRLEVSRERGLTPLVGREGELGRLTEAYRRAAGGEATIVLVAGDPGVGKSRLLYEFLRSLDGAGFLELEATCVSYGRSMPYYPILELLRRYLGLLDGIADEDIRRRVAERLQSLRLEGEEPAVLLAHFLGVSAPSEFVTRLAGAQLKERTFNVLRAMFLRASEAQPLVLVVENLHWLDASSEEFLRHLAEGLPGHRVLLLLSARPGPVAPWLAVPLAETITLEGLDPADVRGMIRTLLAAEVSEQLHEVLVAKGEGNPLYVEEILRQLQETGGIIIEDGEARLREADVRVPGTIHDIIAARIDRLAEPLKQTLQVAAVVGREFAVPLLSRVLDTNGAFVGHLRDLQVLDFVFLSAEEPELVYSFKHALTQEVAYASLLERRRRLYHAAVGVGLEELYAGRTDDVVELLAHHFWRSGESEKAVDYALLAAEKAQRRWANTEALALFESALKRLESMPDAEPNRLRKIDAVLKQAEIKFALGRQLEHMHALEQIRELIESSADAPRRAAWYYWVGFLHSQVGGRPELPIAYCRQAVAIADAGGFADLRAFAECCLAQIYLIAGSLGAAIEAGDQAFAVFEAQGNVWWACRTLWQLIPAANALGRWDLAQGYVRRALEHGQQVNDLRLKVVGWWRSGSTHIQRGDLATGLRCCEQALSLSPIPFDFAMASGSLGYGLIKSGRIDEGIARLTNSVAWLDGSNLRYARSQHAVWLVEGYLRRRDYSKAQAIAAEVVKTCRELGYRHLEGVAERLVGASLISESLDRAASHLETALRILNEVDGRNEVGKTLAAQAELEIAAGNPRRARQLLQQAQAIFTELGTLDEPLHVRTLLTELGERV